MTPSLLDRTTGRMSLSSTVRGKTECQGGRYQWFSCGHVEIKTLKHRCWVGSWMCGAGMWE